MTDGDRSNGWESVAQDFIDQCQRSTIGVSTVARWAATLPAHAAVLDLGCGPGSPRSDVINAGAVSVCAVDAAPTLAHAYHARHPDAMVECADVEDAQCFDRQFDGVLAWGLLFLIDDTAQRALIRRVAAALVPGGRFLFTAPTQVCSWADLSTGRLSRSLGAEAYNKILAAVGLDLVGQHTDEGGNHYFDVVNRRSGA